MRQIATRLEYVRLNSITAGDSNPMLVMNDCTDSLGDALNFSTLGENPSIWQVEVDDADHDNTSFTSHCGLLIFSKVSFELLSAPGTFRGPMDVILSLIKWQLALVQLDDIITFSQNADEHKSHVHTVLSLTQSLRHNECQEVRVSTKKPDYLGHMIGPGRLEWADHSTRETCDLKTPRDVTSLISFLRLGNIQRRFVPNFALILGPRNKILKKGELWTFEILLQEVHVESGTVQDKFVLPPELVLTEKKRTLNP